MSTKTREPRRLSQNTTRITLRVLLFFFALAATALGCGWMGTSHSVRFNYYQTEREMGRLPPLPTLANGLNDARAYWEFEDTPQGPGDDYSAGEKRTKEVDGLWDRAEVAERDGNLRLDRDLLNEYLKCTEIRRDVWFNPTDRQTRRNSSLDRLEALSALDHGSSASNVKAYLNARHIYDSEEPGAEDVTHAMDAVQADLNLRDNVAYLRSADLYRQEKFEEAAGGFRALISHYPHSEKREAALFMSAVSTMKTSLTYIPGSGNSDYATDAHVQSSVDEAWHQAYAIFQKVITHYPRGRYFNEARGWLAYLMLRNHDRAAALAQYYRLLADKHDENARIEAAFSLTLVRSSATEDEMSRVERELADEPDAALAYAYHNIYNYSIDPGDSYPTYNEEPIKDSKGEVDYEAERLRSEEQEKEWTKSRDITSRRELIRTLDFSKHLLTRYPNLLIGGAFALRVAQANEELDDNSTAVQFAGRALITGLSGDERAQALWTLGIAEHRLHHFDLAKKNFTTLLRDHPQTRLTEGARRALAMIAEDAGDIDGALEQYIALDYDLDVAYFVDTLMTPEQLEGFIQRHPDSPRHNEFTYALGMRYLRANRWQDARKIFALVQTNKVPDGSVYSMGDSCRDEPTTNCADPKTGNTDENGRLIITPQLLMRDVQTANDLESLERIVDSARLDEAKAEALYQFASYQYEASSLLFYNPLASPGYWNLSQLAGTGSYRVANESQILWAATQERERLARALKTYLDIVNRFPRTRAARDSLYTAAVCHERLSNYNPYWREIYQNGLHAGERMVTYQDVKSVYPDYQLPRGTYGWQPSTRTVNNGPGWQAPPKPPHRLTKTARLMRLVQRVSSRLQIFWLSKGRRWLTELVIIVGVLCTARVAARHRKRLRIRVARLRLQQSAQRVTYPWFELFWIDPVKLDRREHLRKVLKEMREEFLGVARDPGGKLILVKNIFSHSVLLALLIALFLAAGSA